MTQTSASNRGCAKPVWIWKNSSAFAGENYSKEAVLGQEVYGKIFRALTEKEKREVLR